MTQIYIDGNDIKRLVFLKFDIDAPISYEDFCSDSQYMKLFNEIKEKDHSISIWLIQLWPWGYSGWINQSIQRKVDLFTTYDFVEEYKNGMSYPWWYNDNEDKNLPRNQWFYDEMFNFQINEMQHYFTKNHVVLDKELRKTRIDCWAVLIYPELLWKMQYAWDYDAYLETGRNSRKNIKFTQEMVKHKRMEYVIFMALISDDDLYLVTNKHFFDFYIVSESNLPKYIDHFALVQNISWFMKYIQKKELLEEIVQLKEKYGSNKDQMQKVIKDLLDMIKKTGTLRINLDVQNHNPMYMKWQFKTNDMNKYAELKEYTSDYWFVAEKNHKWSKKTIVGEKEFKYKKSWNTTKNK